MTYAATIRLPAAHPARPLATHRRTWFATARTCLSLAVLLPAALLMPGAVGAQQDPEAPDSASETPVSAVDAEQAGALEYVHERAARTRAMRTSDPINMDGVLDEAIWSQAPALTEFTQVLPLEGQPGSERTEVRIVFNDEAIYVGATLYDSQPVTTRLARRDSGLSDSDGFEIKFDSHHDHETAYVFATNPSAVRRDAIISGGGGGGGFGGGGDSSWDPVWDVATNVTPDGWTVEMRIPFSQLRYQPTDVQVWGLQVERTIHRNQEEVIFPFIPALERGGVSRYGHLDGIEGIGAGRRLELLPYVAARGEYLQLAGVDEVGFDNPFRSGSDHFADVGADLKYRLGSNLTLDATVNPDFGQVELDPSVINLTAFETRYEERRPFFVEGADIFQFGEGGPRGSVGSGPQLLYSRRIGRSPQGSTPSAAVFDDVPSTTTILGAAKVTGRVGAGWSLGILEAVTAEESAPYIDASGDRGEQVVEPATNYLVGRLRRQFGEGETRFGVIGSATNRNLAGTPLGERLHRSAYAGGIDFAHEWGNREWRLSGVLTGSLVQGNAEVITRTQRSSTRYYQRPDADHLDLDPAATSLSGYYAFMEWSRLAGTFTPRAVLALASPGYEVNDLGFQSASDRIIFDTHFQYNEVVPGNLFRSWNVGGGPDAMWNYDGRRIFTNVNVNINFQFLNYWSTSTRLAYEPRVDDDRLTRGGPMASSPAGHDGRISINSDSRRSATAGLSFDWSMDDGGSWSRGVGLNLNLRPRETLQIRVSPNVGRSYNEAQYVTSVADELATDTFGRRYVFAGLDRTSFSVDTRVNVTFSPTLSLQLYAEPFISIGDYGTLREFAEPGTYDFLDYGEDVGTVTREVDGGYRVDPDGEGAADSFLVGDRDFSYRSLIGNAVLRWEWRPGSTLYLVWQQRRIDSVTGRDASGNDEWVGEFDLSRDTEDMFGTKPDNVFVIKVNYWLNP